MKLNPVMQVPGTPGNLPIDRFSRSVCEPLSGEQLLQVLVLPDRSVMLMFRVLCHVYGTYEIRTVTLVPNPKSIAPDPDYVVRDQVRV